jgi:hypothetical protein
MKPLSPTLEGFRVLFRHPALGMAEIAWRWSVGATACLLLSFAVFAYLDTLPLSKADSLFLRSRQPFLISQAIAHLFRGSGFRFALAMIVSFAALAAGWTMVAALGRAATLQWLVEHFRGLKLESSNRDSSGQNATEAATEQELRSEEFATATPGQARSSAVRWQPLASLAGLNFFRVALTLAAICGCVGAVVLSAIASSAKGPHPAIAFLLMVPLVCLVWMFWSLLNWFLSLASVFVMRDHQDTFGSVSAAVGFCRRQMGGITSVGFWFGLAHLTAFIAASALVSFPIALSRAIPSGVVLGGVLLVTLLYFAVVDFLYAGRLAAYVAITELREAAPVPLRILAAPPHGGQRLDLSSGPAPGPEDDILSDVPLPPPARQAGPE